MTARTTNQKAWWLVAPVVVLVAFNALVPMMTVVNYSFQETFGDNVFFWEGFKWYEELLRSERFHDALVRQLDISIDSVLSLAPSAAPAGPAPDHRSRGGVALAALAGTG